MEKKIATFIYYYLFRIVQFLFFIFLATCIYCKGYRDGIPPFCYYILFLFIGLLIGTFTMRWAIAALTKKNTQRRNQGNERYN